MALASVEFKDIVGPEHVRAPGQPDEFQVDGLSPQVIVQPATYDEVAGVLGCANDRGLAVIAWGGGTMMGAGNRPQRYDIALSLSRLDRVVGYEPADLTVTCQAGITLQALQRTLSDAGQTLPVGPYDPRATIGGILAAAWPGPLAHRYGRTRDLAIGLRVATAEGRMTRSGGVVVKNVAGYDLNKLYIGSFGTLGVIAEATFKVAPLPLAEQTLTLELQGAGEACRLATDAERRGLSASSFELQVTQASCLLIVALAGSPRAVERSAKEIVALLPQYDACESAQSPSFRVSFQDFALVCRLSVTPTRVAAITTELSTLTPPPDIAAWPTLGIIRAGWQEGNNQAEVLQGVSRILELGESRIVEVCTPDTKQAIDVFGDPPPSFPLMRAIKQQFDPNGILSPGRLVGRL